MHLIFIEPLGMMEQSGEFSIDAWLEQQVSWKGIKVG